MFRSLIDDIQQQFRVGNMVTRLVFLNLAAFLTLGIFRLVLWLGNAGVVPGFYYQIRKYLTLSSDPWFDLTHPWVFITAIFLHEGLWHLIWNMVFLYWFGRIVGDLIGNHRVWPIYFMGGLVGGLCFILGASFLPYGQGGEVYALGASGSVMALVLAAGMIAPDYRLHLLIIGEVSLKYIVAVLVIIDMISLSNNINTGGHLAHLGGAFFGYLFVVLLRQGYDLSLGLNQLMEKLERLFQKRRPQPKIVYRKPVGTENPSKKPAKASGAAELDLILDKIKHKGLDSLTEEERKFLENQSKTS
jgi:membrane associated rhomboid family serine protease